MENLFTQLDQDTLYWLLGGGGVALFTVLFVLIARRGAQSFRDEPPPQLNVPPGEPLPSARRKDETVLAGARGSPGLNEALTAERVTASEAGLLPDFVETGAPLGDVPTDLLARPGGSAPRDPLARPHTPEEIRRPERKALDAALTNTKSSFLGRIKTLFSGKETLKANELEELEEILYTSDLGPQTVQRLLDAVQDRVKSQGASGFEAVRLALKDEMLDIFESVEKSTTLEANGAGNGAAQSNGAGGNGSGKNGSSGNVLSIQSYLAGDHVQHGSEDYLEGLEALNIWSHKPAVLMVVGVNGAGKTTTIGKLARRIARSGRRVLVAAGDTFRAAAGDQLKVWTDRAQVEVFSPEGVTDPSAVAYQAVDQAQKGAFDVVIIDTAGRLHTQKNLMEELKKMRRVVTKLLPTAPHEVLLVLDANSGQNALIQAKEFHQALEVTGVVLTKLDGTAKGGVAVGLAHELKIPIKLIGVGEGIDDLRRFSSREFVDSIL